MRIGICLIRSTYILASFRMDLLHFYQTSEYTSINRYEIQFLTSGHGVSNSYKLEALEIICACAK